MEEIRPSIPSGMSMAQFALKWILMFNAVTCAIPGGKSPEQVADNCRASDLPSLPPKTMETMAQLYKDKIAPLVHQRW